VHNVVERELRLPVEEGAERLSLDVRHHVVEQLARLAGREDRHDVRMRQLAGQLDLAPEPLPCRAARDRRVHDLDRNLPARGPLQPQVDRGHAAAPDLAQDLVVLGQAGAQGVQGVGHHIN
jgi:hypothetical protein